MTACAPASLVCTSETVACFCSRLRPKFCLLPAYYGEPGIRNAVCVGHNSIKPAAPTVFDDCQSHCCACLGTYADNEATSTFTPTPIVLDTDSFLRKMPFVAAGFALLRASTSAARFSLSCSAVNEARPIVHCTTPVLSARNCTWPAFAFFTAPATSGVTVPT